MKRFTIVVTLDERYGSEAHLVTGEGQKQTLRAASPVDLFKDLSRTFERLARKAGPMPYEHTVPYFHMTAEQTRVWHRDGIVHVSDDEWNDQTTVDEVSW